MNEGRDADLRLTIQCNIIMLYTISHKLETLILANRLIVNEFEYMFYDTKPLLS